MKYPSKIVQSLFCFWFFYIQVFAQTNILSTSNEAEKIMTGDYDPNIYKPSVIISDPSIIVAGIINEVSSDSLKSYLLQLSTYNNRNTGSDTSSDITGIGAARRWAFSMFQRFSSENQNRLIPSYLQFNQTICNVTQHRNIFSVLPGLDTSNHSIIIIEAHIDSRCKTLCDSLCRAEGMEDNGSGTALVMELARVMSKYCFNNTIVFLLTIGEEQGLYGAYAFADYVTNKGINVKMVLNNDIVGGIICGKTSSPPSCPGENDIDSTQVRIFSFGKLYSIHKGLARFITVQYLEEIYPLIKVPMAISLMDAEDRTGRGGDHIPFKNNGIPSVRFTSANEHGNANSSDSTYTDRQHTENDILGADTNNDGILDSFYVDFNYLNRNTVINGVSAGMAAIGTRTPTVSYVNDNNGITVSVLTETQYLYYRVGVRTIHNDFDAVYVFKDSLTFVIPNIQKDSTYYICIASADSNGIESLFTKEVRYKALGNGPIFINSVTTKSELTKKIKMLQNIPNPFSSSTVIPVVVNTPLNFSDAYILVSNLMGQPVTKINANLKIGNNTINIDRNNFRNGIYNYSLVVDGKVLQTEKMLIIKNKN